MTALIHYDAACRALAAARSVDEVKEIADKAEAVRVYARQAKNRTLELDAAEIRIRAERRLGELIRALDLHRGRPHKADTGTTLEQLGVSKKLSVRSQALAAVEASRFDAKIAEWRSRLGRSGDRITVGKFGRPPATKTHACRAELPADWRLLEGSRIADVVVGRLLSLIQAYEREMRLLEGIYSLNLRSDSLATVAECVPAATLEEMMQEVGII